VEPDVATILRIEHRVASFDRWREAFEADPVGRQAGGVRRYRIMRASGDPNYVLIDLEFDAVAPAQEFAARLRQLWEGVAVIRDPTARMVELVEERSVQMREARA
jgi:hypothetical protein